METEISIQPVVESTAHGISALIEYGVLGTVACIALGFSVIVAWVLVKQAKSCFEGTKIVVENNTKAVTDLKDSNREALHGVQIALARLETKLDAR